MSAYTDCTNDIRAWSIAESIVGNTGHVRKLNEDLIWPVRINLQYCGATTVGGEEIRELESSTVGDSRRVVNVVQLDQQGMTQQPASTDRYANDVMRA